MIDCNSITKVNTWIVVADLDSNGWPQTGRKKALDEIRKSFAFMLAGDQHLATVIHHGADDFDDAGFSFCVPSIVNFWPRSWLPLEKGIDPISKKLEHTGKFHDGFDNKLTMHAYANPYTETANYPKWAQEGRWGELSAGHGIVRFNKKNRTITMECWPRGIDVTKKNAKQFPGWPVTIHQQDNYARKPYGHLPKLLLKGIEKPVIQVVDQEDDKVVYTIGVNTKVFQPKVFKEGYYTVIVEDRQNRQKTIKDLPAVKENKKTITIDFKQ